MRIEKMNKNNNINNQAIDEWARRLLDIASGYKTLGELAQMTDREVIEFIEMKQKINGGQ
jgi:hypothetical protein